MKVEVYDMKNNKVGRADLPDSIFNVKWNPGLVHQVLVAQVSNRRNSLAHTKDRSEVRGGGKKPWKQKHTGRARAGSSRSPIWAHGGVTHGPRNEKIFQKKVNKKMKRQALYSILSKKLSDNELRLINELALDNHKTKNIALMLKKFLKKQTSVLFIPQKGNRNVFLAGRNIPKTKVVGPESLNVYDCLSHKEVFIEKDAVSQLVGASKK